MIFGVRELIAFISRGIALEPSHVSKINEFVPYTRIGWYGYAPRQVVGHYLSEARVTRGSYQKEGL
jgi:hypothetical protein